MQTLTVRTTLLGAFVAAGMLLATGCASQRKTQEPAATEQPEMDPEQMMEAYAEANAPNEHHARLAKMAGEWSVAGKSWMAPDQPAMETTGTAVITPMLDGRFMRHEYSSEFMGQAFRGIGIDGYDNTRKQYFSCWYDSMSTGVMVSWGDYDAVTRRLTMHSEHKNPITGTTDKLLMTVDENNDDEVVVTMYMVVPGGENLKHMELTYTRR